MDKIWDNLSDSRDNAYFSSDVGRCDCDEPTGSSPARIRQKMQSLMKCAFSRPS